MEIINITGNQRNCLISVVNSGAAKNIEVMRKIGRVYEVLAEDFNITKSITKDELDTSYELSFEDADYAFLKERFNTFENWNVGARKLVLEVDTIINKE